MSLWHLELLLAIIMSLLLLLTLDLAGAGVKGVRIVGFASAGRLSCSQTHIHVVLSVGAGAHWRVDPAWDTMTFLHGGVDYRPYDTSHILIIISLWLTLIIYLR